MEPAPSAGTDDAGRRGRRRLAWGLAITLLLIAGLAAAEASGWPMLREPLRRALERAAGVPVTLSDDLRVHLFGRRIDASRLTLAGARGVQVPHLLDARDVRLQWRWTDLWRWRRHGEPLRVQSLSAGELDAHLVRLRDGRASWQIGRPAQPRADDGAADAGPPQIGLLSVRDGRIVLVDQPFDTELRLEVHGAVGDGADTASRGVRARAQGRWRGAALRLDAFAERVLPLLQQQEGDGAGPAQQPVPLRIEGRIGAATVAFDGRAAALFGARRLQGAVRVSGPSLADVAAPLGVTLPSTPPFELHGTLGHAGPLWQLQVERASIGRSRLAGDFRYDTAQRPPRLSGRLTGQRLALRDLGASIGAEPGAAQRERVLPRRPLQVSALRVMDADVQVAVDELDFGSAALAPMRELRTRLRLDDGVLQLHELQAGVAGGRLAGTTRLEATQPPRWFADLRLDRIDLDGWIRALRAAAPPRPAAGASAPQRRGQGGAAREAPPRAYLTGTLVASAKVEGEGDSAAAILSTLDGQARLLLRDGTMSHLATEMVGLDIAQAIGVAISGDKPLPLRCAIVDLAIDDGIATTRRALIDNPDSTLRIAARIDLRQETIAARARAEPKDMSPLSLRTPVVVTGKWSDPVVGIEGSRALAKLLAAAALGAVAGPAALLPLIDPGSGDNGPDPCAEPAARSR